MNLSSHITHTIRFKRRPFVPQGCTQQGRIEPTIQPQAAECCSEIGAEPERKRRLGPLTRFERRLLQRRPTYTFAAAVWLAVFAAAVRVWS